MAKDKQIQRRVFFYRMFYEKASTGVPVDVSAIKTALARIASIDYRSGAGYLRIDAERSICAWLHNPNEPSRIILGTSRSSGFPLMEEAGRRSPLPLQPKQNLLENTHMIFFDDGILAAEFNFYGPRAHKLADFMATRFPQLPPLHIEPITNREVTAKLIDLGEVRALRLRLHRDYFDLLRHASQSMADAFDALEEVSDAPVIEVVLKQVPRKRKSLGRRVKDMIVSMATESTVREAAECFEATAFSKASNRTRTFDFLQDQFDSVEGVARAGSRTRAVDSDSMFVAIEKAYNTRRDSLLSAVGLSNGPSNSPVRG